MNPSSQPAASGWHPHSESVSDGFAVQLNAWVLQPDEAPTVLLIHGMEEHSATWEPLCQRLCGHYRFYGIDLPWSGREGYRWGHLRSPVEWLQQGLSLLPSLPEVIVAHSFGASTLLEYLHQIGPTSVKAVVLVSPYHRADFSMFDWPLFYHSLQCFRLILEQGLLIRRGARTISPQVLTAMTNKVMDQIGPHGFIEFFAMFARSPALDLSRIRVPVLILGGRDDCGSMPAENTDLARGLPDSTLQLIPACGHFCMLEHPDTTAELIHSFLANAGV